MSQRSQHQLVDCKTMYILWVQGTEKIIKISI